MLIEQEDERPVAERQIFCVADELGVHLMTDEETAAFVQTVMVGEGMA